MTEQCDVRGVSLDFNVHGTNYSQEWKNTSSKEKKPGMRTSGLPSHIVAVPAAHAARKRSVCRGCVNSRT